MDSNQVKNKFNNKNTKLKYHETQLNRELDINKAIYVPGLLPSSKNNQNSNTDVESYLIHPLTTYNRKEQMVLDEDEQNKGKDYRFFTMQGNTKRNTLDSSHYVNNGYKGNGRGFGNLDEDFRLGNDTRQEKKTASSHDISEFKINKLYYNFHDPSNVVLPFHRGGIDTRNLDKYRK